jgi:hypothetical protein
MKTKALAPIEVEILLWRGSPQKIETDSGIKLLKLFNQFIKHSVENKTMKWQNGIPI